MNIRNIWRELVCFVNVTLIVFCVYVGGASEGSEARRVAVLFLAALNLICSLYMLRSLWRKKWKKRFLFWGQKTIEKAAKAFLRFVERFLDKLGISIGGSDTTIGVKVSVTVDKNIFEIKEREKAKKTKWKHLKNNKERLGFLYKYMIVNMIKHGKQAFASDTPREIKDRYADTEGEDRLFELYISTRYDDRAELSDEDIENIKIEIEKIY